MTDFLAGFAAGASCAFGVSFAFVMFCLWFAKSENAVRPDPYEQPIGEGH